MKIFELGLATTANGFDACYNARTGMWTSTRSGTVISGKKFI